MRLAARVLPAAALLLLVAGLSLQPMAESDLFFRIKAGQEILARHGLPDRNLYSFTAPDHPDLDTAWLFEVGAAALHRRGGWAALIIAKTLVLGLAFITATVLCRRRGAGPLATAVTLAAVAFVARDRFVERPHLFSFLGAVALLVAADALRVGSRARAVRVAAAMVAGVALWANLHAGVFVAPVLLASAALGARVERDRRGAVRLALVAAASVVAMLATPVGAGLFRYLRLHLIIPAVHPVDEFRAPTWISDAPFFLFVVAGGAVLALGAAVAGASPPRAGVRAWLRSRASALGPAAVLLLLAARSVRFAPDAALVAAPVVAVALTAVAAWAGARRLSSLTASWMASWIAWGRAGPVPTVAVSALIAGLAIGARPKPWAGLGLDERELPLDAIAFVDAHGLRDRMYNDFEIGSYLIFDPEGGFPRHRVFVDPRLPAYPLELHRLLGRDDLGRAEWGAAMDRYGVESALLAYAGVNRRVAWWDPAQWALVYRAHDARVFARRLPRHRALIAAREIPATFSFSAAEGTRTEPLEPQPAASPVAACEWQRRLGDLLFELDGRGAGLPSPRAIAAYDRALAAPDGCLRAGDEASLCAWRGALALGAGRSGEALALLDRARAHGDRALDTLTNRAIALEGLDRRAEAAAAWTEVIAAAGDAPLARRARERRQALER